MKKGVRLKPFRRIGLWSLLLRSKFASAPLLIFSAIALFFSVSRRRATWLGPFTPAVEIWRSPLALPFYAGLSLLALRSRTR